MRKLLTWALLLAVALSPMCVRAETDESVFEPLSAMYWYFSSGVGAWSTDLYILSDGSFSGEFHDSDMGDMADDYPDGTIYYCAFTGRMSLDGRLDENTLVIRIDSLEYDRSRPEELIEDGTRYIAAEPYGLSAGDEMLLYQPGTPLRLLSEEMLLWTHAMEEANPPDKLETWFLCSEKNESGFVGVGISGDLF